MNKTNAHFEKDSENRLWFTETLEIDSGRAFKLEVEEILVPPFETKFQEICLVRTKSHGRMLILDGAIQCTEKDESGYQEMISHPALYSHSDPRQVLVVGGGDGGVVREVTKHSCVQKIDLVEIDEEVVNFSRKHLSTLASKLDDPRVRIYNFDGSEFIKHSKNYDVIIVDTSDPYGPATPLFSEEFFKDARAALTEKGIFVMQGESMHYHLPLIAGVQKRIKNCFDRVQYYHTQVSSYPSGTIGFNIAAKDGRDVSEPLAERIEEMPEDLRYYTPAMHRASFALPAGVKRDLEMMLER